MLAGRKVSALSEESLGSVHILVAEDEAFSLEAVRKVLNNIGAASVETASNGADALKLLEDASCNLDLNICDIEMPDMSCYEFVRILRYLTWNILNELNLIMITVN